MIKKPTPFAVTMAVALSVSMITATLLSACCPAESGVPRITAQELYSRLNSGDAVAVDTRDSATYRKGHIEGAVHIPLSMVEARAGQLPRDKLIAAYCT
jgi:predicted sulfurtransferase